MHPSAMRLYYAGTSSRHVSSVRSLGTAHPTSWQIAMHRRCCHPHHHCARSWRRASGPSARCGERWSRWVLGVGRLPRALLPTLCAACPAPHPLQHNGHRSLLCYKLTAPTSPITHRCWRTCGGSSARRQTLLSWRPPGRRGCGGSWLRWVGKDWAARYTCERVGQLGLSANGWASWGGTCTHVAYLTRLRWAAVTSKG